MKKIAALLLLIASTASAQTRLDLGGTGANLSASPAGVLIKEAANSTRLTTSTSAFDPTWLNFVSLANCKFVAVNASGNLTCGTYVTSSMIEDATIVTGDIATGGVTSANILDSTITSNDLASGSVTNADVANDAITSAMIVDSTITSSDLGSGSVTNADVANDAITSAMIVAETITNADIGTGAVGASELAASSVAYSNVLQSSFATGNNNNIPMNAYGSWFSGWGIVFEGDVADQYEGDLIAASGLTADRIWELPNQTGTLIVDGGTGNVTSQMILNDDVASVDIRDDTVAFSDIDYSMTLASNPAMGPGESWFGSTGIIFEGSTSNADNNEGLLTAADPTADRTWTLPNVSGTIVTTGDTGSINSTMLASGSVTNADVANDAITSAMIVDSTITSSDLGSGSVTNADVANDAITSAMIVDGTVLPVDVNSTYTLSSNVGLLGNQSWFASNGIIFEGASANAFEGLLTVVDPTDDRTWTLPNNTGVIVTNGDMGSVTNAMLGGSSVTYDKIQDVTAGRIIGRDPAVAGQPQEISPAAGLTMSGTSIQTTEWVEARLFSTLTSGGITFGNAVTSGENVPFTSYQFPDSATNTIYYLGNPGPGWDQSSINVKITWTANTATSTHSAVWRMACKCINNATGMNVTTGYSLDTNTTSDYNASNTWNIADIASLTASCGGSCLAGSMVSVRISRVGGDASDDLSVAAHFLGALITY